MKVSVIIPAVEGDPYLEQCIQSVKDQTYKDVEIIVVKEGKERSEQRNIGIDRAKGRYLLFLDSDMKLHPCVIGNLIEGKAVKAYIPEIVVGDKVRSFERSFYNGTCIDVIRWTTDKVRFDETLTGPEDWDWDKQQDIRQRGICHYPLYHLGTHSLERKEKYAKSFKRYRDKWCNDRDCQYQFGWKRVLLFLRKPHRLLLHPILTIKMVYSLWKRFQLLSRVSE